MRFSVSEDLHWRVGAVHVQLRVIPPSPPEDNNLIFLSTFRNRLLILHQSVTRHSSSLHLERRHLVIPADQTH